MPCWSVVIKTDGLKFENLAQVFDLKLPLDFQPFRGMPSISSSDIVQFHTGAELLRARTLDFYLARCDLYLSLTP